MFPVIEYIKTIINGMKMFVGTAISKAIKSSTADWNQNDQNTPDYVKNRTHYTFVDKCFVDMLSGSFDFIYAGLYYCATIPCGQPLLEESEYKMVWNGEEYVFPCKNYKNSLYFGNITYGYSTEIRPPAESDDAPFLVVMTPGDGKIDVYKEGGGTVDITLSVRRKKTIKLDEKYIPDSIARDAKVLHPGDPLEVEKLSVGPDGTDTLSPYSVAVGRPLETGRKSLAVGDRVKSTGEGSFAQGQTTSAFGTYSHAQGHSTLARGTGAHAEGDSTSAWGNYSHAEGHATYAGSSYQHAFGRYNVVDSTSKYIQIAGNGKASSLSNAYTLDWDGNGWFAGDVFVGGASQDEGVKLLKAGEAIPIPQTASVGQTVVVKAVDENGKPTEWAPATLPDKLPNPNALTFTGAVTGSYDGSKPLTVDIPSGGGDVWELIQDVTTEELVYSISFENLKLKKARIDIYSKQEKTDDASITGSQRISFIVNQEKVFYNLNSLSSADNFETCAIYLDITSGRLFGNAILMKGATSNYIYYPNNTNIIGETIDSIEIQARWFSGLVQVFSIGTNVKIYGVKSR